MNGLLTDLYELTMAAGYAAAGKDGETATFELFVRRLPPGRDYLIAAGLAQAVDYLLGLRFREEEIAYLRGLPKFQRAPARFWDLLAALRFTGDLWAVPEGTAVYPGEPLLTVRGPLIEAQIPETFLLATISFQTMIATKAAVVAEAAAGRIVAEFGTRRAHSPEAGVLAARAAYIGGCAGTSNVEAGFRYGIPVMGTSAHSWVQAFRSESEAFRQLQELLGSETVHLIDTYDTAEGARRAAALGEPLWGVRLDSGDLDALSREVRGILDSAGLRDARIMASGDLNERKVRDLVQAGAPVDAFGVGTELSTSSDAPTLGAVYKLVEHRVGGEKRYPVKLSPGKRTYPGAKQVFRFPDHDMITLEHECPCDREPVPYPLLRPVILRGELVEALPDAASARQRATRSRAAHGGRPWPVGYSDELERLRERSAAGAASAG